MLALMIAPPLATGDKGGDLIDLVRYLDRVTDIDACNKLAAFLCVEPGSTSVKPPRVFYASEDGEARPVCS